MKVKATKRQADAKGMRRSTTKKSKATDEAQKIREVVDDWAHALRNKDAHGVLSHYAPAVVHFSLAPPLLSAASNAEGLNSWFTTWEGPIGYEIRDLSLTVGDHVAFTHSLNRMRGTKTDGSKADLWFRHTLCFRKIGGEWKIAHEHESVPFYMDGTDKAAIDLKP
jgi:ketosteroid isomerase-like protein